MLCFVCVGVGLDFGTCVLWLWWLPGLGPLIHQDRAVVHVLLCGCWCVVCGLCPVQVFVVPRHRVREPQRPEDASVCAPVVLQTLGVFD